MAKRYEHFEAYLTRLQGDTLRLTYDQIRELSGLRSLPRSVYDHPHQYLSSSTSQPIPAAWMRAGWRKFDHNYDDQYIDLHRAVPREATTLADETADDGDSNENPQLVLVKARRGQTNFRNRLLQAYGTTCAITGSEVVALLEAAHIVPHAQEPNYSTSNGLLLRADVHTLFDLHQISINSDCQVVVSRRLHNTEYAQYEWQHLKAFPKAPADQPSAKGLKRHLDMFLAIEAEQHQPGP